MSENESPSDLSYRVTVADYCPTCGILVPELERFRAVNEALKKQLEEKQLEIARPRRLRNGSGPESPSPVAQRTRSPVYVERSTSSR
jgi:hypothetical protein